VTLLQKKFELGTALFSCAYQNDISGLMAGNIFRKDHFAYFDTLDPDQRYTIRMGVDLASSEKERADYTARVTTAEDDAGNFYVLSVARDKRETHHAEFVNDGFMAYPDMDLVICENQQFQSTLIQEVMEDYPRIPIEGKKSDVDKVTRARAVAAKYEAGRIHHRRTLKDSDFERELLSFPKGHDDMVDALGFSMDLGGGGFIFGSVVR
jgi:predicted phage terminase large subunit-like protein